jgi:hypothetical protein
MKPTQTNTMSPTSRWETWLSAQRVATAGHRRSTDAHTAESLYLVYVGLPGLACDYTKPRDRRSTFGRVANDVMYQEIFR